MPYKKQTARRRRETYSEGHVFQLKFGHAFEFLGDTFGEGAEFDEEAARAAWQLLRLPLLRDYAAEHPCRRPAAWWWFDAPELRRRLDGGKHPCEDPSREVGIYRGKPQRYATEDDFRAVYESEPAYLSRLKLLTSGEKAYLEHHPELLEPESHERRLGEAVFKG
jgi:hypothetical protein